jgi:hypothetical protein
MEPDEDHLDPPFPYVAIPMDWSAVGMPANPEPEPDQQSGD